MANQRRLIIFGGVIGAAVIGALAGILLTRSSGTVQGAKFDYSQVQASRTEDGAFVLGDPNAPVTIVEFADFLCPHCQDYTEVTERVIEEYVLTGQAKFEYRFFPTTDRSLLTPALVECAAGDDPARFWVAHDIMFDLAKRGWNQNSPQEFARRMNMSYGELLNCARDADQYETDARLGQSAGVTGTPAVRVRFNDGPLQAAAGDRGGPSFEVLSAIIQQAQS